jgi:hypothetical protein
MNTGAVVNMLRGLMENAAGTRDERWRVRYSDINNRRLLEPIGNIPPAEAEERYYAMLEQPAMAA